MSRGLISLIVLVAMAAPVPAQTDEPRPTRLTVRPAALPEPALKYELLPELKDKTPGNGALLYQRAHSPEWWSTFNRQKDYLKVERWLDLPLTKLPRAEMRFLEGWEALREIDRAARRQYCDWEMVERVRTEGVSLVLGDVQGFRQYGNLLAARARLEMADGAIDRAVYTLQTGFTLSRDVARGPTIINFLVGVVIARQMAERVEELMQLPQGPNLYWALTTLPDPLLNLRRPLQGERLFLDAEFPELKTLGTTVWTPQQQESFQVRMQRLFQLYGLGGHGSNVDLKLYFLATTIKVYPEAKRFLLAHGRTAADVEAMPALQAVMLFTLHNYQKARDDIDKWVELPYWQASPGLHKASREAIQPQSRLQAMPFMDFLPAVERVYEARVRLDRHLAALRCIEAVRLYAAVHQGKLPASLRDITEVPIPVDPVSGRDFDYAVNGDRVTLRESRRVDGRPAIMPYPLHYEVTFQR